MAIHTRKSYCRFCHNYCALEVDIENGRAVAVRGDANDPIYGGYTCIKGRQLPALHVHPTRLLVPHKRQPDGSFKEIGSRQALDEIAARISQIIDEFGPRAVASYCGTYAFQNSAALAVAKAWHHGIDSESFYSSVTIDQPAKFVAMSRAGGWHAGGHGFREADVVMIIGCNTIVSQYSPFGGIPPWNPVRSFNEARKRGLEVIAIDPRRSDLARRADIHLQVRPGEDPTLLSGMLRVILEEDLHDKDFCADWIDGLDELRESVSHFDLDYVAQRTRVPIEQIVTAARMFAQGRKGVATAGTGPDMSPRGNLTEHLVIALNMVCGRVHREGDRLPNPGVLSPQRKRRAQAIAPWPAYGSGPRSRVRGLGQIIGEMPTAALSDEILEPGEGQVKALMCIGGNPVVAWPDQQKTVRAMQELSLLVCVDIRLSATSKMADYVLAPKLTFERADLPVLCDTWYEAAYTQYAAAVVDPPPGADVLEEWELYWELAHRMGTQIALAGGPLSMDRRPSKDDVMDLITNRKRFSLEQIKSHEGGHIYTEVEEFVGPPDPSCEARIQLAPDGIAAELAEVRGESAVENFSHRLISRRLRHVYNSSGQQLDEIREKGTTNPAFINPIDLEEIGITSGEILEISSAHSSILGVAQAAEDVPPGVISMAHAWGDPAIDPKEVREIGSSTNRLVSNETDYDPISGMARQSAIPVNLRPVQAR